MSGPNIGRIVNEGICLHLSVNASAMEYFVALQLLVLIQNTSIQSFKRLLILC